MMSLLLDILVGGAEWLRELSEENRLTIGATVDLDACNQGYRDFSVKFLTVNAIIGNQAFRNGQCHTCSTLGLD